MLTYAVTLDGPETVSMSFTVQNKGEALDCARAPHAPACAHAACVRGVRPTRPSSTKIAAKGGAKGRR